MRSGSVQRRNLPGRTHFLLIIAMNVLFHTLFLNARLPSRQSASRAASSITPMCAGPFRNMVSVVCFQDNVWIYQLY
jgi:hypothetical protein